MKVKILSTGGYPGMKNAVGKIVEIDDFEEGEISAEELIRVGADPQYFIGGNTFFFTKDEIELVKNGSKFNVGDVVTINIDYVLSYSYNNFFGISKDSVCRRFNLNFKIVEVMNTNPEPTYMFENSGFFWPEGILKLVTTNPLTFAEKYKIGDKIKLNTDYVFENRENERFV